MTSRVLVAGAGGRMGRMACELLERSPDFALAGRAGRADDLARALGAARADLLLDLTVAGLGAEHGRIALAAGVRPVIGTSGVTAAEVAELDRAAREVRLGGLVVPNFSLGACLLQRAAALLAARLPAAEIVELHHDGKRDSPSATALHTADAIAAARGGERDTPAGPGRELVRAGVPIHSVRLPGLLAHQEVLFGAPGEVVTLRHDVTSRDAYGPGILAALSHALGATGVACGLSAALAS